MDKSQITPGSWKVNTSGGMTYVENFYNQSICRVVTSSADANLIAAAPDLLAALILILPQAGWDTMDEDELGEEARLGNGSAPLILQARAAIAKAEGKPYESPC